MEVSNGLFISSCTSSDDKISINQKEYLEANFLNESCHCITHHEGVVPLFNSDIHRSKLTFEVLGISGFENYADNYIILNNVPILMVKMSGMIVGATLKSISLSRAGSLAYIFFEVDDYSGGTLLVVKLRIKELLLASNVNNFDNVYGQLIEAVGFVVEYKNEKEFHAKSIKFTGRRGDLGLELEYWKEKSAVRDAILSKRWSLSQLQKYFETIAPHKATRNKPFSILSQEAVSDQFSSLLSGGRFLRLNSNMQAGNNNSGDEVLLCHQYLSDVEIVEEVTLDDTDCSSGYDSVYDSQLTAATIRYMLNIGTPSFKLIHLFQDRLINSLLTQASYSLLGDMKAYNDNLSETAINNKKIEIFHSVRHRFQVYYKLIKVTKKHNVKSSNLLELVGHLKQCLAGIQRSKRLQRVQFFNIQNYLNTLKNTSEIFIGNLDKKIINLIVDWIICHKLGTRDQWKYDSKLGEWSFIGF